MKKLFTATLIFCAVGVLVFSTQAFASKKRGPASSELIPCLNAVSKTFNDKWWPIHTALKVDGRDMQPDERNKLQADSQRLLHAKSDAIVACQNNDKAKLPMSQILDLIK